MDECLIHFRLIGDDATAFKALCAQDMRKPSQEARYLVMCELARRGPTPVAPDRAEARDSDGAGDTRAAGEHDG